MIAVLSSRFVRRRISIKGTFADQLLEFKHVLNEQSLAQGFSQRRLWGELEVAPISKISFKKIAQYPKNQKVTRRYEILMKKS